MGTDFTWNSEYSTGIEEIDVQHERLLNLLRTIHEASERGMDDARLRGLLEELIRTFRFHFESEELLMKAYEYPRLSEQKMEHELMTRNVLRLSDEAQRNRILLTQLLFNIEKWFVEHDNAFDKDFGAFAVRIRSGL